jgi:hypothetical protein
VWAQGDEKRALLAKLEELREQNADLRFQCDDAGWADRPTPTLDLGRDGSGGLEATGRSGQGDILRLVRMVDDQPAGSGADGRAMGSGVVSDISSIAPAPSLAAVDDFNDDGGADGSIVLETDAMAPLMQILQRADAELSQMRHEMDRWIALSEAAAGRSFCKSHKAVDGHAASMTELQQEMMQVKQRLFERLIH